jgi:hypothetical protein
MNGLLGFAGTMFGSVAIRHAGFTQEAVIAVG